MRFQFLHNPKIRCSLIAVQSTPTGATSNAGDKRLMENVHHLLELS